MAYSVTVDEANAEFVVGYTEGNLDGEINAGDYDAFAQKFNNQGVLQ